MKHTTGVLLVNLGTPLSPKPLDVYKYLIEFLTDKRVIDIPWLKRQFLVRGAIVPFRFMQSARSYANIWTKDGSPLMVYSRQAANALQETLGDNFKVALAMRYQKPSIQQVINELINQNIQHLIVLPLFPQYASATTGSVLQRIQEVISQYEVMPKLTLIDQFATHPSFINALCTVAKPYDLSTYDHILFSFHGLPERQVRKADKHNHCLKKACCNNVCVENYMCYPAQCHATMRAIATHLKLPQTMYSHCFQSRLGKDPWLQPYASNVIEELAKKGKKKILVFSPSFVCDCLETIFEIGVEYQQEFQKHGGQQLDLVPGLNSHPAWIGALHEIIHQHAK